MWEIILLFLLILLTIVGLLRRNEYIFWIVITLSSVACGVVADIVRTNYLADEVAVGTGKLAVFFVILSFLFFHVSVYGFVMFALSLYRMSPVLRKAIAALLLVPIIYDAINTPFIPVYEINYTYLMWFYCIYAVGASLLIIWKYRSTPPSLEKSYYLSIILIYLPPSWIAMATLVIPLGLNGVGGEWPYYRITLQLSVIIAFLIHVYYLLFPGFLGMRFSAFRRRTESRVMASGMDILNHSLKNEANKILFITSELKWEALSEEERSDYITMIEQSAKEMSATLEKLNAKTRAVTINLGVVTAEELLENVRQKIAPLLHHRNVQFHMASAYSGTLLCDVRLLSDDLNSLIDNAIYATAEREHPVIRLEIGSYGRYAYISLWDNGCGIPRELRGQLFQPYFTTKNKASNFGIGLYSCYHNVVAQRGLIHIESEEGSWTKVNIYMRKGANK